MDTDDLTQMAYDCIIIANKATDVLKTELGAACSKFKNEDEYLKWVSQKTREIIKNPEGYLDSWTLLDEIDLKNFNIRLIELKGHVQKTIQTPYKERNE